MKDPNHGGDLMTMPQSTVQLLIAEHSRLQEMEKSRLEMASRGIQRFLTVATAAIGVTLILVEKYGGIENAKLAISTILVSIFLFGIITFLRLLAWDTFLMELSEKYGAIRSMFVEADPALSSVFPEGVKEGGADFRFWASMRGILKRAFAISGPKTTVVFLNCLTAATIGTFVAWPRSALELVILVFALGSGTASIHASYASWRYRMHSRYYRKTDAITRWI